MPAHANFAPAPIAPAGPAAGSGNIRPGPSSSRGSIPTFVSPVHSGAPPVRSGTVAPPVGIVTPTEGFAHVQRNGGGASAAVALPGAAIRRDPSGRQAGGRPTTPTTPSASVAAMPAVQKHLESRGLNFDSWSAGRSRTLEQAHAQNTVSQAAFQVERGTRWRQLRENDPKRIGLARSRGADWNNFRRNLWNYRYARADEIRDHIGGAYDHLFTTDWWHGRHGHTYVVAYYSPWWWWTPCDWATLNNFCNFGSDAPVYYDYDANVVTDNGDVYVDGQDWGSSADYSQLVTQLANPQVPVEEPTPPQSEEQAAAWQPLGVFALTQEERGDAVMFFQLSVNHDGLISGAYTNVMTGDSASVTGAVDRATQRAAWHVGDKKDTIFEAGIANLTQEIAPIYVHFDNQATQTWLLVRMASPELPTTASQAFAPTQQ